MQQTEKNKAEFIVGIGASAGGLEALERFFRAVTPSENIAYIVIQHLSPDFESIMGEILSKLTPLTVKVVEDGMPIEPNTIYLNIPRVDVTVSDGKIRVSDKVINQTNFRPIDALFESLAKEQQQKGIAIVLSGTGLDGSRGVKYIASHKGLVMAQHASSALFTSMPKAAHTAVKNCIMVLPEDMPASIKDFILNPEDSLLRSTNYYPHVGLLTEETAFSFLISLLHQKYETDFSNYKPQTITRRLERRISLEKANGLVDIVRKATEQEAFLDQLYRELLIDVTQFFRDKEAFDYLEQHTVPQLVQQKNNGDTIRVWVSACSSGEEAYSLTVLFLEEIRKQQKDLELRVFASDLHRESIAHASRGVYPAESTINIPKHLIERYFHFDTHELRVRKALRQKIVFTRHDLFSDPYFGNQDFISCRNMLIYVRPEIQLNILERFTRSLNSKGILFLGPSEYVHDQVAQFYTVLNSKWRLLQQTTAPVKFSSATVVPTAQPVNPPPHTKVVFHNWEKQLLQTLVPTGYICNSLGELKEIYGDGDKYLKFAVGRVNLNLTELLPNSLSIALRNCLSEANREGVESRIENVQVKQGDETEIVNITVVPFELDETNKQSNATFFLIKIEKTQTINHTTSIRPAQFATEEFTELHSLKLELAFTRENLHMAMQELESANADLQTSNEELMTTNEEIQSTNEELNSVNEELFTINSGYQEQNKQLNQLFNDKLNLELASGILTFFLDEYLHIRDMTPACYKIFGLIEEDKGRPIIQFATMLGISTKNLQELGQKALRGERSTIEVKTLNQNPMLLSVIPYQEDSIEPTGIILNFIDLTELQALQDENEQMLEILNATPVAMAYLDHELRYRFTNEAFVMHARIHKQNIDPLGLKPADVLPPNLVEYTQPFYEKALSGEPVEFLTPHNITISKNDYKMLLIPHIQQGKVKGCYTISYDVTEFEQERQKVLVNLKNSETQYRSLVEHIPDMFYRFNTTDLHITFHNQVVKSYFPNVGVGCAMPDIYKGDETRIQNFNQHLDKILQTENSQVLQAAIERPNGETRIIQWLDSPIFDDAGTIVEIQGIGRDITEIQKTQDALVISQSRYQSVVDTQDEMICRWRPDDFVITFSNLAFDKNRGYLDGIAVGISLAETINDGYLQDLKQATAQIVQTNRSVMLEEIVDNPHDASERNFLWHYAPIYDAHGNVVEIQGAGRDVTAERQAQRALQLNETLYKSITNTLPEMIARWRPVDLVITFANTAYANYFGQENKQGLVDTSLTEHLNANAIDTLQKVVTQIAETGKSDTTEEVKTTRHGARQKVVWTHTPISDETGNLVEIQTVGRNVTNIQQNQEQLTRLQLGSRTDNHTPFGLAIVDRQYRYRYMSPFYKFLMGKNTAYTSLDKTMAEVMGEKAFEDSKSYYDLAFAGQMQTLTIFVDNNGVEQQLSVQIMPDLSADHVEQVFVVALNMHELNQLHSKTEAGMDSSNWGRT